ncbi:uncharacterized protein MYCGRDRAFT_94519 [Zymoseptoria tritici IPO323]|uniref:Uncharacterized protein n=1 Tax=Zymoseptoria tritici (strain CBS 115943 / IPO323) TaxID=336722 RepID=F9XFY4_ZYMTI|nr:uncharacterized protein MYCGRDRAFT_94519 [Zymoseptoria tritici IPO323]EGP85702.1 hypothetical protein MYCGRDRAFT_94519 [Zymoseptoria tritici IPO323]
MTADATATAARRTTVEAATALRLVGLRIKTAKELVEQCDQVDIDFDDLKANHPRGAKAASAAALDVDKSNKERGLKRGGGSRSSTSATTAASSATNPRRHVLADKYLNLPRLTDADRKRF